MPPFSKAYAGELGPGEIESIVAFMRYTWDDRIEIPAEAAQASAIPELASDEVPSYEVHVAPIMPPPGQEERGVLHGDLR